jgi:hypothetical protein
VILRDALRLQGLEISVTNPGSSRWLSRYACAGWRGHDQKSVCFAVGTVVALPATAKTRLDRVCGEDQGIDLKPCIAASGTLAIDADQNVENRLKIGLRAAGTNSRVGLDPEAFALDVRMRPMPFPGFVW